MLRAGLGNQQHRDLRLAQRVEQPVGRSGHADHPRALQAQHGDVLDHRDALDGLVSVALGGNQGTSQLRMEARAYPHGDLLAHDRTHGLRMDHPRAEIGQLHGLVVGQLADHVRLRNARRIGAHHALHVGPYGERLRVKQRTEYRRREIAAVAPQGHLQPAPVAGDIARDHPHRGGIVLKQALQALAGSLPVHHHAQFPRLHAQDIAGIQPPGVASFAGLAFADQGRQQASRPQFPASGHQGFHSRPGRSDQHGGMKDIRHIAALVRLRVQQRGAPFRVRNQFLGDRGILFLQGIQVVLPLGVTRNSAIQQREQRVGHALHGRHHHGHPRRGIAQHDPRGAFEAARVSQAAAAEFMYCPGHRL